MTASSPGKLFILGEYAVLEGAPALLVPVKQRAESSLEHSGKTITSITTTETSLPLPAARRAWPLLDSVLETLDIQASFSAILDTSAFFRKGQKLGLGSSAAMTVSLVRAFNPDKSDQEIYQLASRCHRHFQKGAGSGADIALSVLDQPTRFSLRETPLAVTLPPNLHLLAIWTGKAASTRQLIAAMKAFQTNDPVRCRKLVAGLTATADDSLEALAARNTQQFLAGIERYGKQLLKLSSVSGVNFYNELHLSMQKKVELAHCIYKPSGAGGGDFGIACTADREELVALAETLKREQTFAFVLQ